MNETANQAAANNNGSFAPPVFILGIMPRCGTNFLSNLLILHPECGPPDPVWEDFLVAHSDLLAQYSDSVAGHWYESWGISNHDQADLDASLGKGLSSFLNQRGKGTRLITKTPRVDNLELFFRFFPEARLLILVRDGRAVIESASRSFGWRRETTAHALASAARTIKRFEQHSKGTSARYRIIRYEDLWKDMETQLRGLFSFLELDPDVYDFDRAHELPVKGSSDLVNDGERTIHWDPIEKTNEFDPMSRHAHWSAFRQYRYDRVAGQYMEALGYSRISAGDTSWLWWGRSLLLDASWWLKCFIHPLYRRLRSR